MRPNAVKHSAVLFCSMCISLSTSGDSINPSAEFWRYMAEYTDQSGEVFDPVDLETASRLVNKDGKMIKPTTPVEQQAASEEQDHD